MWRPRAVRLGRLVPLALFALWVAACGDSELYEGVGVVEDVDRAAEQVVIAHEEIVGLMPAMTMNFDVAHPALLEPLEPGQTVRFKLRRGARDYRIVEIRAEGSAVAVGGGGRGRTRALADGRAPDFELIDQHGAPFSLASLRGRVLVLDFIYTHCPGPCPALTGLHVDVQRALPAGLRAVTHFVSVSIDPVRDTPDVLRAYAEARGIDQSDWTLATGEPERVAKILRAYAVGSLPQSDGSVDHQILSYLIDRGGGIAGHFWGSSQSVEEWVDAIARVAAADPSGV